MKFSLFYHSLVSDWNHGNAHFLRGIVSELMDRGHQVCVYEPADGWSRENLLRDHGPEPLADFQRNYPSLQSYVYQRETLDLGKVAADSDVVIVHEWNEPWLVNGLGEERKRSPGGFRLLFHDTHHRIVSDPDWLQRFKLDAYDGVLAFGEVISEAYRHYGWNNAVWTWHEAADTRIFYPCVPNTRYPRGDVVWIGNWGDDERTAELEEFLFEPVRELVLKCHLYGVRYPGEVLQRLARQNTLYLGWLANFHVPDVFANHKVTVHVPRRYYRESLPGIPTIRPFEAMACGIPLVSAPWEDSEGLFTPGEDYLLARDGEQMKDHLRTVLQDRDRASELAAHALHTIREHHTCAHRVDQLLAILAQLGLPGGTAAMSHHNNPTEGSRYYAQR
ncbi:CgeB family protein [Gilvimarinus sp. F26214L]|uniref:CgeB family protein n=1 Tax=Gilvimarinus sp. DZF01 TaxID=3461371 RepID=UPI0040462675